MKYAIYLFATALLVILVIANNSGKSAVPARLMDSEPSYYGGQEYVEPDDLISDRKLIRQKMQIEIVPMGTIPDDIDLDEWVHEIEYEIMSERCDDILETTKDIKRLVETRHGSASKE